MIKTIIFDIGGVVIGTDFMSLFNNFAKRTGANPEFVREYNKIYKDQLLLGSITMDDFWKAMITAGANPALDLKTIWVEEGLKASVTNNELIALIKVLRTNYSVGTLTNVSWSREIIDEAKKLYDNFDYKVMSCVEHLIKPNPKIYKLALERAEVNPEEAIFVDDRDKFMLAAQEMNIHAIHYRNYEQLVQELTALGVETK